MGPQREHYKSSPGHARALVLLACALGGAGLFSGCASSPSSTASQYGTLCSTIRSCLGHTSTHVAVPHVSDMRFRGGEFQPSGALTHVWSERLQFAAPHHADLEEDAFGPREPVPCPTSMAESVVSTPTGRDICLIFPSGPTSVRYSKDGVFYNLYFVAQRDLSQRAARSLLVSVVDSLN